MTDSHPTPAAMTTVAQAVACSAATIDGVFRRAFTVFADRVAVVAEDTSMTYAELRNRAWQLANALTALGLGRGSRIAVLSETRPEYVETYAACAALGVTVVALNIRLHPEELLHCLEKAKPSLLISSGSLTPLVVSLDRVPYLKHWIALDPMDGWLDYGDLLAAARADEPPRVAGPEDIHNVLFTSGTTGRPKGATISQRAAAIRGLRVAHWFRLTENDGFLCWLPLFHCGGDESLYATLISGGVFATLRKAAVETMFSMIERYRLSWTFLLPGIITEFLNHPRRRDHDLSSLRFAGGYANMMPDIIAQLTAACGIEFDDAFGQTEASYLVAHGLSRPGETPSLRKQPTPLLDIRIVDDAMNDMPVGEPGECIVRGPGVMSGYLDDPKANEEVFAGGWLHTGDLLRREPDGTVTYVDRKRYLIKTGGENVYPAEVEQVIVRHEAVQEVCVVGVPDSFWGETVKAVIVLREGQTAAPAEIVRWCRVERRHRTAEAGRHCGSHHCRCCSGQPQEALPGLVGRHWSVVDLTADRPLKHGRVDECPRGRCRTAASRQAANRGGVSCCPILRLADAGSGSCLRAAKPFVETDAAEARFAQGHQRALLDPAAPVSGLGVTHDLTWVAERLQISCDDFVERCSFRAGDLDDAVSRRRGRNFGDDGGNVVRRDGLEQARRKPDYVAIRT